MTSRDLVPPGELTDAAFSLLTTSSVDRYIRVAREAASRSALRHWLASQPERISELLSQARAAWRAISVTSERDIYEWRLAIVLPILAQTATPEVDGLLRAIGLSEQQNAAWLAALARRLVHVRADNKSGLRPWRAEEIRPVSVENRAESYPVRVVRLDGPRPYSSEDRSSQRIARVAA